MNSYEKWKEDAVRSWFEKHKATRRDLCPRAPGDPTKPDVVIIDWRKPGTSQFSLRYLFDVQNASCTITGDLGEAVVNPRGWELLTPEKFANSFSPHNLRYFDEKLAAKSDHYDWSRDQFRADCAEELGDENSELIESFAGRFSEGTDCLFQNFELSDEEKEFLRDIDEDYDEWFWTLGRGFSIRVYAWVVGLQMAMNQLGEQS